MTVQVASEDSSPPRALALPFAATIFLGAFLLFQLQPLIGKYVLPWFGGATAVWATCMLFFQTLLLLGYAYAHLSTRWLSPRMAAVVHVLLLLAALCVLPISPSPRWKPGPLDDPTIRILALLTACVGLPYFVLSTTGPLLQAWLARPSPQRQSYRLYALSNVGSFLALLSYPVIVEPLMTRRSQAITWSVALGAFAIACAYCAVRAALAPSPSPGTPREGRGEDVSDGANVQRSTSSPPSVRSLWLLLPACASLLLLAVTNKLCQDVAVVPLLWILPLALYLLSFVICFDSPRWYDRRVFVPLLMIGLAAACWATWPEHEDAPIPLRIAALALALFACCMSCHGELYRLKPPVHSLTSYYLLIAAGGSTGGAFVALLAPLLFTGYTELQIGLLLAFVLLVVALHRDSASPLFRRRRPLGWLLTAIGGVVLALVLWPGASEYLSGGRLITRSRNFYGVLTVYDTGSGDNAQRLLHHGGITHGVQMLAANLRRHPTAYYGRQSGVGVAIRSLAPGAAHRIGAIGLGAGTLAAYAEPGDLVRFYEINPMVIELARSHFSFLPDCRGSVEVVPGDARLSLERQADQRFDVLAVDAFSGDAIPVHLLTAECMDLYLRHLAPAGVLAIHVSNIHLDLQPVVQKLAAHAKLATARIVSPPLDSSQFDAEWILLARDPALLQAELILQAITATTPSKTRQRDVPLWTDDYSDLIRILQ